MRRSCSLSISALYRSRLEAKGRVQAASLPSDRGGSGSGRQAVFLHDPSVARRDISGHRPDTRHEIALSREISDHERRAELSNHAPSPLASGGQREAEGPLRERSQTYLSHGCGPPASDQDGRTPRLSRESSSARSTAPHDDGLDSSPVREGMCAGLAGVGRRTCAGRARAWRRAVRAWPRGWPRLVASAVWRRG
jgi:hypothetical protein